DDPVFAFLFEPQVLPGQAGILGKAQLRNAGPPKRDLRPFELDSFRLAVGTMNPKFPSARGGHIDVSLPHCNACYSCFTFPNASSLGLDLLETGGNFEF